MKKTINTMFITTLIYTCALFYGQMTGKLNISLTHTERQEIAEVQAYDMSDTSSFDMPLEEVRRQGR